MPQEFDDGITFGGPPLLSGICLKANEASGVISASNVETDDPLTEVFDREILQTFIGATPVLAGISGAVPAPAMGEEEYVLDGNAVWRPATTLSGLVATSGNFRDHHIIRGNGGGQFIQDSEPFIDDDGKMTIPDKGISEFPQDLLQIGSSIFPLTWGFDSGGTLFCNRGVAGTLRYMNQANFPQMLWGNGATDGGAAYLDTDSLTTGSRPLFINVLAGAGAGALTTFGSGGINVVTNDTTPIGATALRWQRSFISHMVGSVDSFAAAGTLDDATYVVALAGTYTLTLPTADTGWAYTIERRGTTGTITLAPAGGDTINGGGSVTLDPESTYLIFAVDTTDWRLKKIEDNLQSAAISVYDTTGGQTFTGTLAPVNLDTTAKNMSTTLYSLAADVITVAVAGTYKIEYQVSLDISASNSRSACETALQIDTGGGFGDVAGTLAYTYNRLLAVAENTAAASIVIDVGAGDQFQLRATRIAGGATISTRADGTRLTITRLGA